MTPIERSLRILLRSLVAKLLIYNIFIERLGFTVLVYILCCALHCLPAGALPSKLCRTCSSCLPTYLPTWFAYSTFLKVFLYSCLSVSSIWVLKLTLDWYFLVHFPDSLVAARAKIKIKVDVISICYFFIQLMSNTPYVSRALKQAKNSF